MLDAGGGTLRDASGKEFRVTRKRLGRGTFADVYLGEWLNPQGSESVKVAMKHFNLTKQTLERAVETEIAIMQTLDHPNIVKLIAAIKEDNTDDQWVVLEYCEGGDFKSFLKDKHNSPKQNRLSEKYACMFMKQIVEGLRYLRSKNIVHRDLKPHNLLMTRDHRTIKIADFGFARILGSQSLEATLCGSPLYMAPEVLRGEQYNSKADLWSLGIILYEMLCACRPYKDVNDIVTLRQRVEEVIQFPKRVQISRECRRFLIELLQKDPVKRLEWEALFEHEWLKKDWMMATITTAAALSAAPSEPPLRRPLGIPVSSAPIVIPANRRVKMRVINNYMDHLSSAPARVESDPTIATSPWYSGAASPDSMFIPSTTPYGGSEPDPFRDFGTADDDNDAASAIGSSSAVASSRSFRRSLSEAFSTGFGLLKDSFHTGY